MVRAMQSGSSARRILLLGWVASLGLAFAAGQWARDDGPAADGGDDSRAAADVARPSTAPADEPAAGPTQATGEGTGGAENGAGRPHLSRVIGGSRATLDWESAGREAGLLGPEEARAWFESVAALPAGRRRDGLLAVLVGRMARNDPARAMERAGKIASVTARERARREVLAAWADRNPMAALVWIEGRGASVPGRLQAGRFESWIAGYARSDPSGAFAYAAGLPEESRADRFRKREMVEEVIEAQVEAGRIGEALAALEGLPPGPVREEAAREFYAAWADEDPAAAAGHFFSRRDAYGAGAAAGLVRAWAETDPGAAAEFVGSLGPGDPAFEVAVSSLVERWSRFDLSGPAEWLNQLPPSEEIDRAVAVLSVRAAREDPEGAMTWAESISAPGTRDRVMRRVAAGWREVDPEGFSDYLETTGLDEDTRDRLRQGGPPGGFGRRWRD